MMRIPDGHGRLEHSSGARELTILFPYSPVEHAEALSEAVEGRRLPRRMRLFGLALGSFGVLWSGLEVIGRKPLVAVLQDAFPWMALGAFWFWAGPALLKAAVVWERRREGRQESRETERLTFSEAGFSPSQKWPQPMPWSFVDRVIETKRFLLIYHGYSKDPFYLPKHALSPSDQERLFVLLREHLTSSPGQLQLLSGTT